MATSFLAGLSAWGHRLGQYVRSLGSTTISPFLSSEMLFILGARFCGESRAFRWEKSGKSRASSRNVGAGYSAPVWTACRLDSPLLRDTTYHIRQLGHVRPSLPSQPLLGMPLLSVFLTPHRGSPSITCSNKDSAPPPSQPNLSYWLCSIPLGPWTATN